MQPNLIAVGTVGLNLTMLVSWEWNPDSSFLVIHMLHDVLYLRGQQGQAMWLLLDTLATLRMVEQGSVASKQGPATDECANEGHSG